MHHIPKLSIRTYFHPYRSLTLAPFSRSPSLTMTKTNFLKIVKSVLPSKRVFGIEYLKCLLANQIWEYLDVKTGSVYICLYCAQSTYLIAPIKVLIFHKLKQTICNPKTPSLDLLAIRFLNSNTNQTVLTFHSSTLTTHHQTVTYQITSYPFSKLLGARLGMPTFSACF